jgi:hypothetical protein
VALSPRRQLHYGLRRRLGLAEQWLYAFKCMDKLKEEAVDIQKEI